MNETENNTSGPEASARQVMDFNGTEIRPGLWAIEDAELQRLGNAAYQAGRAERTGEVAQLREALELASQQQAKIAAALGLEPGEDVLAEVEGIAEILRKSCAALGIHAEHAADIPGIAREYAKLRYEVIKALGFSAADNFPLFLGRAINAEVEKAHRRLPHEEIVRAVEAAEIRTRKACADQVNAAQAMIDRATKEHEEERVKFFARIAEVEKQRDESRAAHADTLEALRQIERNTLSAAVKLREILGAAVKLREILGAAEGEQTTDAAHRVVHERNRATQDGQWWKNHAEAVKAENSNLAQRLDAREKAGRAERDATARTVASLQRAREDIKHACEANGRFVDELRTILGAQPTEATIEAARRVVAERDAATKAKLCQACGIFSGTIRSTPGCTCGRFWIGDAAPPCPVHGPSVFEVITSAPVQTSTTTTVALRKVTAGEMVSDRDVMPVVTFGVGQW